MSSSRDHVAPPGSADTLPAAETWTPAEPFGEGRAAGRSARRRILDAASELFYREGLAAVGVNRIIEHADVAKATLYQHFGSKEDLIVAWLAEPRMRWITWVRPEVERRADGPRERLLAFFEVLGEWLDNPEFRGCPFVNAAAETPDPTHPVRRTFADHEREVGDFLSDLATRAGYRDPPALAAQLFLIAAGAITKKVAHPSGDAAGDAYAAAELLLDHAPR